MSDKPKGPNDFGQGDAGWKPPSANFTFKNRVPRRVLARSGNSWAKFCEGVSSAGGGGGGGSSPCVSYSFLYRPANQWRAENVALITSSTIL